MRRPWPTAGPSRQKQKKKKGKTEKTKYEDKEEEVNSYWLTLSKQEYTGN
jgi:hypothetical protein